MWRWGKYVVLGVGEGGLGGREMSRILGKYFGFRGFDRGFLGEKKGGDLWGGGGLEARRLV